MKREVCAVLFDLDDTLHDDSLAFRSAAEEVAREVAAAYGVDALALKSAYVAQAEGFWRRLRKEDLRKKFTQVRAGLWSEALRSVGLHDEALATRSARLYNEYRKRHFALFPGAIDLLRALQARGTKTGLVTNGVSETHHEKIALLQLTPLFDAIFLADEVGMLKPDPLLFAHACAKLGCSPRTSVMVGDRYERDIAGANEAGLGTIWVNVRHETLPAGAVPPDVTVASIAEVGPHLL